MGRGLKPTDHLTRVPQYFRVGGPEWGEGGKEGMVLCVCVQTPVACASGAVSAHMRGATSTRDTRDNACASGPQMPVMFLTILIRVGPQTPMRLSAMLVQMGP